jgi:hypothetical protein
VHEAAASLAALGWPGVVLPRTTVRDTSVHPVVDWDASGLRIVGLICPVGRSYSRELSALYRVRDLGLLAFLVERERGPRRGLLLQAEYYGMAVTHQGTLVLPGRTRECRPPGDLELWRARLDQHARSAGMAPD